MQSGCRSIKKPAYEFALLDVQGCVDIDSLQIDGAHRTEEYGDIEMLRIQKDARVKTLSCAHLSQKNRTGKQSPMITVDGQVDRLLLSDVTADCGERLALHTKVNYFHDEETETP